MFTEVPYSTETAARETLEQVMADALSKSGSNRSAVRAVCLAVSGVNHPTDQQRILSWLRFDLRNHLSIFLLMLEIDSLCYFSLHQIYFTFCKAPFFFLPIILVIALASGTMGELHGCVLIAGTGTIAYGFTKDGREARAAGAGPILG
ncbi:hypothetical protein CK203_041679 [Vitis vinifera]|uniref:N-acetyl-D-glucosamine kinase n=1 Tax=Vitis vinifera TaxID=29760 RepID=A0A438HCX4_VITVI|nr:hypothetical protein CK203_041679 [Vitis vinifera]